VDDCATRTWPPLAVVVLVTVPPDAKNGEVNSPKAGVGNTFSGGAAVPVVLAGSRP
jgi:hypothetical protein